MEGRNAGGEKKKREEISGEEQGVDKEGKKGLEDGLRLFVLPDMTTTSRSTVKERQLVLSGDLEHNLRRT
ncbi:hypothetical protein E2C01_061528 [Portunus trituberculatus]|uniref:Uncharacterized protein n=1 Tax=Portunus trituberculatus TaxID=210409 RepID=A0A5B7HB76_PORTR|nr:hypothetical protein [Portunus trituberculatus]